MSTLDDWITEATDSLGLPPDSLPHDLRDSLLDLTRTVAHDVARIAGPLTTFLLGLAVGSGMPPSTAVEHITVLAERHAALGDAGLEVAGLGDAGPSGPGTGGDA